MKGFRRDLERTARRVSSVRVVRWGMEVGGCLAVVLRIGGSVAEAVWLAWAIVDCWV